MACMEGRTQNIPDSEESVGSAGQGGTQAVNSVFEVEETWAGKAAPGTVHVREPLQVKSSDSAPLPAVGTGQGTAWESAFQTRSSG